MWIYQHWLLLPDQCPDTPVLHWLGVNAKWQLETFVSVCVCVHARCDHFGVVVASLSKKLTHIGELVCVNWGSSPVSPLSCNINGEANTQLSYSHLAV